MSDEKVDESIREIEAQLQIMQTLQKVPGHQERERVMLAVKHLLGADVLVPGLLDAILESWKRTRG